MSRETMFYAQGFRADGRKLVPTAPQPYRSQEAALKAAEALALAALARSL